MEQGETINQDISQAMAFPYEHQYIALSIRHLTLLFPQTPLPGGSAVQGGRGGGAVEQA